MKILILGGSGFIGSKITKILKLNHKIQNISFSEGSDLRKDFSLKKKFNNKFDIVINCAAHVGNLNYIDQYRADVINDNMKMYLNLYSSIMKSKYRPKIINLISNCVYPADHKVQKEKLIFEGKIHQSVEPFGLPKLILLKLSSFYYLQHNIESLNLVLPNAFGPGDHLDTNKSHALNGIIVRMIKSKKNNEKKFFIWGSGKPKREWIYADDVARIIKQIVQNKNKIKKSKIINAAQNKSFSINYISNEVKKILKYNCKLVNDKKYPDGALIKQLDNKLFKKEFSKFKFTDFNYALKKTINYYKNINN